MDLLGTQPVYRILTMKNERRTEGALLIFASCVLLLGFGFVFAAKIPTLYESGNRLNINTADEQELASGLGVDISVAQCVCRYRKEHGKFADVDSLRRVPALTEEQAKALIRLSDRANMSTEALATRLAIPESLAAYVNGFLDGDISLDRLLSIPAVPSKIVAMHERGLCVRYPPEVALWFWFHALLLVGGFSALHVVLRKRLPSADPFIVPCAMMLSGLGCILLFSVKDPLRDTNVFAMQAWGIYLGILVALVPLSKSFDSLRLWRYTYIYVLVSILLTILLALFGSGPGGARLSMFGIQPVEVVKLMLVLFVASYLADRWGLLIDRTGPRRKLGMPLTRDVGPLVVMYALSLVTFLLVKDLGPMIVLFGMFVALLYIATSNTAFLLIGGSLLTVSGYLAYLLGLGVFDVRVDMWLHPWQNSHQNGMHLAQSLWAFATSGVWGSGLGLGDAETIPRAGSDLMFSTVGEELGLIGSLSVLILETLLINRCFRAGLRAQRVFDSFLAFGIAALLGIQTIVIVYGVLGLLPLTGITLPFVSFGRSSMVVCFFALGVIAKISGSSLVHSIPRSSVIGHTSKRLGTSIVILLLGVAGVGRLIWLHGVWADEIAGKVVVVPDADGIARAHVNPRLKMIEEGIPRGSIYDRNGRILATSRLSELSQFGAIQEANGRPGDRLYPYGKVLVNIVGYLDPRCGGPVGLEKSMNDYLRGFDEYSALVPIYRSRYMPWRRKLAGKDVWLTIDADLQKTVYDCLVRETSRVRDRRTGLPKKKGAAVVLDVYTGEILAAVSTPTFDPNTLTFARWRYYLQDSNRDHVLIDRSVNGVYPPGSVFKVVTAAAALENGLNMVCTCRHEEHDVRWQFKGRHYSRKRISDLPGMAAHGKTDLRRALTVSCNVYFANLAMKIGPQELCDMSRAFRLSHIPSPAQLAEDLPDSGYGQGRLLVTPLEMARVVAAIANDGTMMNCWKIRQIREGSRVIKYFGPSQAGRPIRREAALSLQNMMTAVTQEGTARGVFDGLGINVAGKTGSAENDEGDGMAHSWFVGFAPAEDPRIAFAVIVENGGFGRGAAGRVSRKIVSAAL